MRQALSWIVAAAAVLTAPMALAQGLDPAGLRELDNGETVTYEGRTVEQLDDMDVLREDQKIGEVDEVLADSAGRIVAVVIDFDDGFLGLGDREVILAIDELQFGDSARGHRHARRRRARGPRGVGRLNGGSPDCGLVCDRLRMLSRPLRPCARTGRRDSRLERQRRR